MAGSPSTKQTRLTITLPTALVHEMDARLVDNTTSRGETIRRLIEQALRDLEAQAQRAERRKHVDEQYERGWREQPLTEEEFGWVMSPSILKHLDEAPWESDEATSGGPTFRHPGDDVPSS